MRCFVCTRGLTGVEYARRVEWRQQALPGTEIILIFGNVPEAHDALTSATGALVRASHHKCYFAWRRREALIAAKGADRPAVPDVTDWHDQEVRDVGELAGEGDRGDGGAGAPGR